MSTRQKLKSTKKRIDKKAMNIFLHALIIFGVLSISGSGMQVLA